MKETVIKVVHQGSLLVNNASIIKEIEGVAVITINMKSTYGDIMLSKNDADDYPVLILEATKYSSGLNTNCKKSEPTEICFIEYKGYHIFSVQYVRDIINVCLIKSIQIIP